MKPVYCDNHVLVLEKPPNMATQPDFHNLAKAWVKKHFNKPGNVFLEPIHRLDKPVGGLVLFARTSKALSRLNASMREGLIQKTYLAKVEGNLETKTGTLRHFLVHGDHRALISSEGKEALLSYKEKEGLIEIQLLTGRYHQIRAQFAAIGHPIVGDGKYGAQSSKKQIALQHVELIFPHPTTKEPITCRLERSFPV